MCRKMVIMYANTLDTGIYVFEYRGTYCKLLMYFNVDICKRKRWGKLILTQAP